MKLNFDKKRKEIEAYDIFCTNDIDKILTFKSTEISKILKWASCAKNAGQIVKLQDYRNNKRWDEIKATLDFEYYKIRYSTYDYEKIYNVSKENFLKKRGSMYDPENIAIKNGISLEDAKKISDARKEKTKITKENLIKKYGADEGERRFSEFVEKSKTTKENYKKRYGAEWEGRWKYFLKTRDSSSLEFYKSKYGDDGEKIFLQQIAKFKKSSDLNYYKEKYGDDEGERIYNSIIEKKSVASARSWSFDHFVEKNKDKYSNAEEMREAFEFKSKSRNSKTIEYFLAKGFSIDEAKILRLQSIETMYRSNNKNSPVSKESILFFSELERALGRKCEFGAKSTELSIRFKNRLYFYDFFDEKTNTIIEYNGSAYHAPERLTEEEKINWKNKYGLSWNEVNEKDARKLNSAKEMGYNIIVVWDYEVKSKMRRKEKIKEIINILGNKQ